MKKLSPATRITISLVLLMVTIIITAQMLGVISDPMNESIRSRIELCEVIAVQFSSAVQSEQMDAVKPAALAIIERHSDLLSLAIRDANDQILIGTPDHDQFWAVHPSEQSTSTNVMVPIYKNDQPWGTVELCFEPIQRTGVMGIIWHPSVRLVLFVALFGFISFLLYMKRILRYLDPTSVIPERVKAMLDTLSEGVILMDKNERIVLANNAFQENIGRTSNELQGMKASDINWMHTDTGSPGDEYPWVRALREASTQRLTQLGFSHASKGDQIFAVNSTPILGEKGERRGALATFDDVTAVEKKNIELQRMLTLLSESREKVQRQNEQLKELAIRDTLTGCLNRRAFYEELEKNWESASRYGHPLSIIILDIDHFKSVNDTHGHTVGDQVLRHVARSLNNVARQNDIICRYGGEEFCILLPQTNIENACAAAEKFRTEISLRVDGIVPVTASFGVSAFEFGAEDPQALIDQADQSLYAAKRTGRDRVIRWDEKPEDDETGVTKPVHSELADDLDDVPIPFHAVQALVAALGYRDSDTADHSRRVADLCVMTARDMFSTSDCFVLEVAGLLHDIGKIGVPDSILLKPGPLTKEEWEVMALHDRFGIEIINAAFASTELTEIIRCHHAFFGGSTRDPGLPTGHEIPLAARILTIADAYDAMVSDRVYRNSMSRDAAFAELRRCVNVQFDPELVETFIEMVTARGDDRTTDQSGTSKEIALRIGLEIERLACTIDANDMTTLAAMASRLVETATKFGLPGIAEVASELNEAIEIDLDLTKTMSLTKDLLDLCRSVQSEFLVEPTTVRKISSIAREKTV